MADLKALIKQGEGISVEFKECRHTLNRDVYKTVCAFLNRCGGTLLLGIADAGEVTGVDSDSIEQIKKDFVTAINNPQTINPACYLSVDEVEVEGKMVLHIYVPENSNKPHGFGVLNPATFTPFPKNPVIGAFFREIHRADQLGSGMRNMMKYGKAYGGENPEMIEGDVFRTIVKYPDSTVYEKDSTATEGAAPEVTPEVRAQVEAQVNQRILLACAEAPLSSAEIAAALGHKQLSGNLRKALPVLRKAGFIEYTIPDKPNSRLQKYRLTDAGKHLLNPMQK